MSITDPFPVTRPARLPRLPAAQQWLLEGLWAHQAVGIIGGEPKSYKSFVALSMAVAVASGRDCLGRYRVEHPGPVLLFAAEDALHIVRARLEALCAGQGLDLARLDIWVITAPVIRLDHRLDQQRLEQTVGDIRPRLLVLDPFVRLHRVDENLSAAVAPLLACLRQLQRTYEVAVALVHHARKGGMGMRAGQALRGSSELHAWGDSNIYIQRYKSRLALSTEHRALPSQDPVTIALETHGDAMLLTATDNGHTTMQTKTHDHAPSAQDRVLQALAAFSAPVRARQLREVSRMKAQSLSNTLNELVDNGQVIKTDAGWSLQETQLTQS